MSLRFARLRNALDPSWLATRPLATNRAYDRVRDPRRRGGVDSSGQNSNHEGWPDRGRPDG